MGQFDCNDFSSSFRPPQDVPYYHHGDETSQTSARSDPTRQADCRYRDWRNQRSRITGNFGGIGVRPQRRPQGRESAGYCLIPGEEARNSARCGDQALGGPKGPLSRYSNPLYVTVPRKPRSDNTPVTVCIAARCFGAVFLLSDRMITAGDIQFEPTVSKISFLTSSIAVMGAGDSAFHAEVVSGVMKEVHEKVTADPNDWLNVKDIVDLYIQHRTETKLKRSEAAILAPLGLDRHSFLKEQKDMNSNLVENIARDLINYEIPNNDVIIAGIDNYINEPSSHIYSIFNEYVSCDDSIGFRAIGSGSRHAESHFMLARHAWNASTSDTLLVAYSAKRNAEIAPGVGSETDMVMIGPPLGSYRWLAPPLIEKLEEEYQKMKNSIAITQRDANAEVQRYVESLSKTPPTAQADAPATEEARSAIIDVKTTE